MLTFCLLLIITRHALISTKLNTLSEILRHGRAKNGAASGRLRCELYQHSINETKVRLSTHQVKKPDFSELRNGLVVTDENGIEVGESKVIVATVPKSSFALVSSRQSDRSRGPFEKHHRRA